MSPALLAFVDRLRLASASLGWPGVAGLALLLAAAGAQLVLLPQRQAEAAAAQEAAGRSHAEYLAAIRGDSKGRPDAAAALAQFRARLGAEREADAAMESIQTLAAKHGLAPGGTEYKWQRQPAARLAEVRIAMPLKAGYAPVHAFVREVLAEVPGLALDQFELQRDAIGSATVDARLRFSLFLRMEP